MTQLSAYILSVSFSLLSATHCDADYKYTICCFFPKDYTSFSIQIPAEEKIQP